MLKRDTMTKIEEIITKTKKLYDELSHRHQQELVRSITDERLRVALQDPKKQFGHEGRIWAISNSKRQFILSDVLGSSQPMVSLQTHKKYIRHMDTAVFKVIFDIMKEQLKYNSEVINKYPELFI